MLNIITMIAEAAPAIGAAIKSEVVRPQTLSSYESLKSLSRRSGINKMSKEDAFSILLEKNLGYINGLLMYLNAVTFTANDSFAVTNENLSILNKMMDTARLTGIEVNVGVSPNIDFNNLKGGERKVILLEFIAPIEHVEFLSFDVRQINGKLEGVWFIDPQ